MSLNCRYELFSNKLGRCLVGWDPSLCVKFFYVLVRKAQFIKHLDKLLSSMLYLVLGIHKSCAISLIRFSLPCCRICMPNCCLLLCLRHLCLVWEDREWEVVLLQQHHLWVEWECLRCLLSACLQWVATDFVDQIGK